MKRLPYNKVVIITLLVAAASMGVSLLVLSKIKDRLVQFSTEQYKQQQSLLADQIVDTLSGNIQHVQNQLKVMTVMPQVKDTSNLEVCNNALKQLLEVNQKQLGNLARTNPDGRFACSVNPAIIGEDSAKYGTYVSDLIKDPEHTPVLGRMTRPAGADTLATGLHVPVYDGDTFKGTLGGALYFSKFQNDYLRNIKFGNGGFVVLMDDNGDILYHPNKDQNGKNLMDPEVLKFFEPPSTMQKLLSEVKAGRSGVFDYSVYETKKFGLYKTFNIPNIKNRNWAVIVTIPVEDLKHVVNQAGINTIFVVLVVLISVTTGLLTFVSLRNTIKDLEIQRMKDDFISITSHQLRTPATIVKQSLGLIKGGYASSPKDIHKFIDSAYESNEEQLSIIENILSVSKLEAGRLEIQKERLVIQDLITKLTKSMSMSLASKKHKLVFDMPSKPIYLQADPTKLSMALENLISNAVKYTSSRGIISVKVRRSKGAVTVSVSDNGKGISKEDISQLFLRFNRLHSAVTSHVPGTGLGLYLTKKIIELHGGSIDVVSREKQGSTFTIKLPEK